MSTWANFGRLNLANVTIPDTPEMRYHLLVLLLFLNRFQASPIRQLSPIGETDVEASTSYKMSAQERSFSPPLLLTDAEERQIISAFAEQSYPDFDEVMVENDDVFENFDAIQDFNIDEMAFAEQNTFFPSLSDQDHANLLESLKPNNHFVEGSHSEPYLINGGFRYEYNHNWPQISTDLVPMSSLTCQSYFWFLVSLFGGKTDFAKYALDNNLIDFARPIYVPVARAYMSFLTLYLCTTRFSLEMFTLLLNATINAAPWLINMHHPKGYTALHSAIRNGHSDAIYPLLMHGADVNVSYSRYGSAALHAIHRGNNYALRLIASLGNIDLTIKTPQEKDIFDFIGEFKSLEGMDVVIRAAQLPYLNRFLKFFDGLFSHDVNFAMKCLKKLLASNQHLPKFEQHLKCLISYLVRGGYVFALQQIINTGITPYRFYHTGPGSYTTLMHIAARENRYNMINYLISIGVPVNEFDSKTRTPIEYASALGHVEFLKCLAPHVGKDAYELAIKVAVTTERMDSLSYLLEVAGNCDHIRIDEKPLWKYAFDQNKLAIFSALLNGLNFDPYYTDGQSFILASMVFLSFSSRYQKIASLYVAKFNQNKLA